MAFRSLYLYSALLLNVVALIASSSARSTGEVKFTDLRDELDRPVYSWMIGEDEQGRLTDLLEYDFHAIGVAGTYVTAPPHKCSRCDKETEFVDWAYTALARGVHSREFIVASLKATSGVHHDVYCSRCGHLTHFRDHSGREGGSMHIAQAAPYDRATKTFGKSAFKREAEGDEPSTLEKKAENAGWCQRCVLGNWIIKRHRETSAATTVEVRPPFLPRFYDDSYLGITENNIPCCVG
ncbi:hypothetical protein C8Q80DRAFT_1275275 [Daedaleopsis nitida]|nr:hypothetical protein C8Q80DRAFT_1275275 [Daedaleopsis nitida]